MKKILLMLAALVILISPAYAMHEGVEHSHANDPADETIVVKPDAADIEVNVFGLVCDFCARAIEKVFMRREEVAGINVDLDNFLVTIDLKDGADIDDGTLTKLITDAGYTVNEIRRANGG